METIKVGEENLFKNHFAPKNDFLVVLVITEEKNSSVGTNRSFCILCRVAGLGENSLIRRLFTLGCFWKIKEVAKIFGSLFSTVQVMY
jgi:hypothetical protein